MPRKPNEAEGIQCIFSRHGRWQSFAKSLIFIQELTTSSMTLGLSLSLRAHNEAYPMNKYIKNRLGLKP